MHACPVDGCIDLRAQDEQREVRVGAIVVSTGFKLFPADLKPQYGYGAYKNVIGLSVGIAVGLGFGDNTTASVITRGLAETARLAMALGADPMTLMGLAGLGDLVATCSSPLSRNRTFGEKLGRGMTTAEIAASTRQVAEGVKSCSSLLDLTRRAGVYAPIVEHVHAVVEGQMTAEDMLRSLVDRDTKHERD